VRRAPLQKCAEQVFVGISCGIGRLAVARRLGARGRDARRIGEHGSAGGLLHG
jgi:hypothetical protein